MGQVAIDEPLKAEDVLTVDMLELHADCPREGRALQVTMNEIFFTSSQ